MRDPAIQRIIDAAKEKKFQADASKGAQDVIRNEAKGLMQTIQDEQTNALRPVFEALGRELVKEVSSAVADAIKGLKVDVPKIDAPQMNVPDIHIPPFNIPTPKVTVNVPKSEKPIVNVAPTPVMFPSEMSLRPNSKPFPVIMMDQAGKPMVFPQQTGGTTGGRSDFFTITSIQGFGASIGAALIDSSGVAYSGSNPVPVTFGSPIGQGDGSSAIRIIQAGDSVSSTNVLQFNGNTVSTNDGEVGVGTLRIVHAANIGASVNIIGNNAALDVKQVSGDVSSVVVNSGTITTVIGITNSIASSLIDSTGVQYSGSNALPVYIASGSTASTAVVALDRDGNPLTTGPIGIGDAATALRVLLAGDVVASVYAQNPIAQGDSATALRIVHAGDVIVSTQTNNVAMTTLPTAVADAGIIFQKSDKLGRTLNRPVNARELIATAYASITTGTETTLLTSSAGQYLDLIYAMATNNSDAAVTIDLRSVNAGNIETSIRIPANSTAGVALPVPIPQSATGNAWTADLPDITGTTVTISALFSKES